MFAEPGDVFDGDDLVTFPALELGAVSGVTVASARVVGVGIVLVECELLVSIKYFVTN